MATGLLGGVLPYIYSRADALKRTLGDVVSNPMASTEQVVNNANDRARYLNQLNAQVGSQGIAGLTSPQGQELTNLYAQAYNPAGMVVYHGGANLITNPSLSFSSITSKIPEEKGVFWVTPSSESAMGFGKLASENPVLSQFNLNAKNILTVEVPVKSIIDGSFANIKAKAIENARKNNNDAIVFTQAGKGTRLLEDEIAILNTKTLQSMQKNQEPSIFANPFTDTTR